MDKQLQKLDLTKLTEKDIQDMRYALTVFDYKSDNLTQEQREAIETCLDILHKLD